MKRRFFTLSAAAVYPSLKGFICAFAFDARLRERLLKHFRAWDSGMSLGRAGTSWNKPPAKRLVF